MQQEKRRTAKTPLWRCRDCGWYLYLPAELGCPLCSTGGPGIPLAADERHPPWRPSLPRGAKGEPTAGDDRRPPLRAESLMAGHYSSIEDSNKDGEWSGGTERGDQREETDDDDDDEGHELEKLSGGWTPDREVGRGKEAPTKAKRREIKVWNVGTVKQKKVASISPKAEGAVRFVCISDTHSKHRQLELPEGDVLIHCTLKIGDQPGRKLTQNGPCKQ